MAEGGKYIYCIIEARQERNFGPIGIGNIGDEVLIISYDDLGMVVSNHPMARFTVSRDNMLAHQKVIEKVMEEFDSVLPVRFGTIAASADEIRNLLDRRCREFKTLLRDMDHKVELGVKGIWKDMEVIFKEIAEEDKEIKMAKERIQSDKNIHPVRKGFSNGVQAKIEIGKMAEQALTKKKEKEADRVIDPLRRTAFDYKLNKIIGDAMFMNAAFLVDKGREKEFDNIMDDLSNKYNDRIKFMYAGHLPVFNFVNIVIYPEDWEK